MHVKNAIIGGKVTGNITAENKMCVNLRERSIQ